MAALVPAEVSLQFAKLTDSRKPVTIPVAIEIDGVGRVDLDLTEHDFVRLVSGSVISAAAEWRPA